MPRTLALVLLSLALVAPGRAVAQQPTPTPDSAHAAANEMFERGLDFYERGEYALAAETLGKLLYPPPRGFDGEKLKRAHLYRGISLFLQNEREKADDEFYLVLFNHDPEFRPDPLFTPPQVIAAFERLKKEHANELKRVPRPRRVFDTQRDPLGIPTTPQPGAGDFWASIAPFGWAQFKNGQPVKGYAFLSAEVVLLSINLTTYTTLQSLQDDRDRFQNVPSARLMKTANNATFFLLLGTLLYGSADGVWTATQKRTRTTPIITPGPGTAGVQMTWQF